MDQAAKAKATTPATQAATQPKDYIIAGCRKICVAQTSPKTTAHTYTTQPKTTPYKSGGAQSSYAANAGTSSNRSSGSSYAANPNAGSTKVVRTC